MSVTIISAKPTFKKSVPEQTPFIDVAEFFCDTIQGEGVNMGIPAAFLRVQHCTQSCLWCDSNEVWRFGNPYTFDELYELMEIHGLIEKLKLGQHLVLTGGSPMKQQFKLIPFLYGFKDRYGFKPYIEVENECVLMPKDELINVVDCWNNSPKLENSYNPKMFRYQPDIIKKLSSLQNSWFKFVVAGEEEWREIVEDFITPGLIKRDQIILMPLGATRAELMLSREIAIEITVREGVRYSDRLHVVAWDKKTGV